MPSWGNWRSVALSTTFSCVALTKVVGRGLVFHNTTDVLTKPVPVTVIVVAGLPGGRMRGAID